MTGRRIVLACVVSLVVGAGTGLWAGQKGGGIEMFRGKPAKDAGLAALVEAERLAGKGSWERIAVGRVYYLSGDKARGQAIFDSVTSAKPEASDWQRLGEVYAQAGETARAEECFAKLIEMKKGDDTGQSEIGSWYIRIGQREKGEELIARALAKNPGEVWHFVRAAEAYLKVPAGR